MNVELIGKIEICRPNSILEGRDGTRKRYHIAGANAPKYDTQTTTKGFEDIKLALKTDGGSRLTEQEESLMAGLGEVKVIYIREGGQGMEQASRYRVRRWLM